MSDPTNPSATSSDTENINNEHRIQLGMINALCEAVEAGESADKIHEVLDQLTAYSELHFTSEELLMRLYSYPSYDDHVLDHEAMTERLQQITQQFSKGQNIMALQTASEMREFLLAHINSRDKALEEFLIAT